MRHQVAGRKLGRKTAHRLAMFRNMAMSLIRHGRIRTTLPKAKELRKIADKLVTLGKKNTLHARRLAFDFIRNEDIVYKLFHEVAPAFQTRQGGYTRIYRMENRPGDAADMAIIEYLAEDLKIQDKPVKTAEGKAKAKKSVAKKPKEKEKKPKEKKAKKEPKAK